MNRTIGVLILLLNLNFLLVGVPHVRPARRANVGLFSFFLPISDFSVIITTNFPRTAKTSRETKEPPHALPKLVD
jgi:hypothetical protein